MGLAAKLLPSLAAAFDAVVGWLEIAAKTLF
jgi:hypothetical protein